MISGIVCFPLLLTNLSEALLLELNILTSGRVGFWYFLVTDVPKFGSISYYTDKQAHNGLFQLHSYYGWIWGSIAFAMIHVFLVKMSSKSMLCTMLFPLFLMEMFLNSYSSLYFLVLIAALFSFGKEDSVGRRYNV